jgi:hypothetical protein
LICAGSDDCANAETEAELAIRAIANKESFISFILLNTFG